MNNETYGEMVLRLKKPGADVLKEIDSFKANLMHATLGIVGEYGEVVEAYDQWRTHTKTHMGYAVNPDVPPLVKELGDLDFYLEVMLQLIRKPRPAYFVGGVTAVDHSVFALAELAKKHIISDKPLDAYKVYNHLIHIMHFMDGVMKNTCVTRGHVQRESAKKLNARFNEGAYSNEQAVNNK